MKINWIGPINTLSYGYTSLHCVDELIKLGHEVALFPIGQPQCHPRHENSIRQALANADRFDTNAPCIRLWHQHDMSMFVGKHAHIGFPIFELDTFTEKERHHINSCDVLYVCSNWAKDVITKDIIEKWEDHYSPVTHSPLMVKVVPLGVDSGIFYPQLSKRKPTIFLNAGKWEVRKGHDILIKAFQAAFPSETNVELWMMCDNPFLNDEQVKYWKNLYNDSRVRFIPRVETDEQVADIMRQADCGVFPSRAEGWNLEALEMLSCGKHVIATDYSAHTEFLTDENAFLMPIFDVEPAYDGIWFHNQGNWGKIDNTQIKFLADLMKYIHNVKQRGELTLNIQGIETAKKFSWINTASTIVEHLGG
jgi:glycosyltransferase involved in cell wall biosynthesis